MDINTITGIEALTESEVLTLEPELIVINEHDIYMVDLGGYFGFSALVFRDGHHLYYANDYELHHKDKARADLIAWYKESMKRKLFSDDMIQAPISDYIEGQNKEYYLYNYYPQMCSDSVSAFNIFKNDEERDLFRESVKDMTYCPIGFFYTYDTAFIDRLNDLMQLAIVSKGDNTQNYDYWFTAFKHEMFNHEYVINWQADWDVISCFANVKYSDSRAELFKAAGFNDIQIKAYQDAARYVSKNMEV